MDVIEKLRISLWDIFSFFLSGVLFFVLVGAYLVYLGEISLGTIWKGVITLPATHVLVLVPLVFSLVGLIIEPLANYFDKWVFGPIYRCIFGRYETSEEEMVLIEEIKKNHMGWLGEKIADPYQFCKDYVETKQLSTTFMVFLARFGFYRNTTFLCVLAAVIGVMVLPLSYSSVFWVGGLVFGAVLFKRRSDDFYRYMAPAVYRAYLIDKLK